ncbi:spirocyclase AveC family protein [Streptomyces sp. NBC_00237]|uniref:spirocyclase AveC family protein n=1 Tax=Streptomyces sp. NBC_00237 TaxID=2975687 RepID=UPI00224E87EB|nr:spirocyclase AveC family protein [Streptomyces sp. NBC_00237]MCX5205770.1 spirocyclase AveC family protein [Streptomyces sp. NBC_00237]
MRPVRPDAEPPEFRTRPLILTPVARWAMIGALCLAMATWSVGGWLLHGGLDVHLPQVGQHGLTQGRFLALMAFQAAVLLLFLGLIGYVAWQCRRQRRFTFDASLLLAYMSMFWVEPLLGVPHPSLTYSTGLPLTPSWGPDFPGWPDADTQYRVGLITSGPISHGAMVICPLATAWLMNRIVRHRPDISATRFALLALGSCYLIDWPLEYLYIVVGGASYATTNVLPALALFPGHWYQFPALRLWHSPFLWSYLAFLIRHHYLTRGPDSTILRGSSLLTPKTRTAFRTLALVAVLDLAYLIAIGHNVLLTLGDPGLPSDLPPHFYVPGDAP